ncbi:hypothetical protein QBC39DRAFT_411613 [Podospora conica]|nr:hypothetical protein QBC39DRAFT_411613 [Schizothecium conicum]
MAPLASEPRHLLLVLNPAKRKALYDLITEITQRMRSTLQPKDFAQNSDPDLTILRNATIKHFDTWKKDVLTKLKEVLAAPDDAAILAARRKRTDTIAQKRAQAKASRASDNLIDLGEPLQGGGDTDAHDVDKEAVANLHALFRPLPTRLTTISYEDRAETLSAVLLLLLSAGHYSGESRILAVYLASSLELPLSVLDNEEAEIATSLVKSSSEAAQKQGGGTGMSAEAEAQKRRQEGQAGRYWKVGLASVAGAAIIGVTGGLAAPVVAGAIGGLMGSVGLGGVASFLGIFWMNGALVGTLFGALGARMTGEAVDRYAREVDDFAFLPVTNQPLTPGQPASPHRLRLTIGINGWLTSPTSITSPWQHLPPTTEVFALRYETGPLLALGASLNSLVSSYAWSAVKLHLLKHTVLATLWSALWPAYLLSTAAATIDNPFSLARNRSDKAGAVLADALVNRVQGHRPVTLIGYSLGARVIHACLRELAARRAFGLVESVVLIGAPVPSDGRCWAEMRAVVAGRVVNVYSDKDCLLAFLYRATSVQLGVAGLQAVEGVEGVVNVDLSGEVQGHLRYPAVIDKVLARCGFEMPEGARGAIEPEEEVVVGGGGEGTLIELDMLSFEDASGTRPGVGGGSVSMPEVPKAVSVPTAGSEMRKPRGLVVRAATATVRDPLSGSGPLGGPAPAPTVQGQPPLFRAHTVPTPVSLPGSGMGSAAPLFVAPSARRRDWDVSPGIMEAPAQTAKAPATVPVHPHHDGADSDDEDGYGIKMVDNDDHSDAGSFTYIDPVPIED